MYRLVITHRFKKDVKLLQKRGYDMNNLKTIILQLENKGKLPPENRSHKLSGMYSGYYEAHIKPDWLVIWKTIPSDNEIWLVRTGTHSDLFYLLELDKFAGLRSKPQTQNAKRRTPNAKP